MESLVEVLPGRQGQNGGLSVSRTVSHAAAVHRIPDLEGAPNLFAVFAASAQRKPSSNCLGFRPKDAEGKAGPYAWISYGEALKQATDVGSALVATGLRKGGRCAIFSQNTPQWMMTLQVWLDFRTCVWSWNSEQKSVSRLYCVLDAGMQPARGLVCPPV